MKREEIQKLLGGYATGTLTPEEQEALFAAALEDQELFDALGKEQALRDLLRDPAAKAELLAVLDTVEERGGFWGWLQRPLAVGVATACVAAMAGIVVWEVTRGKALAPAPVIVAEVRAPESKAADTAALPEVKPAEVKAAEVKAPVAKAPPAEAATADVKSLDASAPEVKLQDAKGTERAAPAKLKAAVDSRRDEISGKLEKDSTVTANAPAAPQAAPAPTFATAPRPATVGGVPAAGAAAIGGVAAEPASPAQLSQLDTGKLPMDARTLFYGGAATSGNAFVPQLAGGSAGAAPRAATTSMRAANIAKKESTVSSLGVRVSMLRKDAEIAVTTVLTPGEPVRLKLTPNEDGFLYVAAREGDVWKMVVSGVAQRLKPFETPVLPFSGSGQKVIYIMLSRQPQTLSPESVARLARTNLVETLADQDRATYVVAGLVNVPPQQVVQAITLTYR